jgi:hypothetical protein
MRLLIVGLFAFAPALAAAQTMQPGSWRSTTRITAMTMPGAPPDIARSMAGRPIEATVCITAQDIAAGPKRLLESSKGQCRYSRFRMSGGVIDAESTCAEASGATMTTVMRGTYTPTSYTMTARASATTGMRMAMTTSGRRVGACAR